MWWQLPWRLDHRPTAPALPVANGGTSRGLLSKADQVPVTEDPEEDELIPLVHQADDIIAYRW